MRLDILKRKLTLDLQMKSKQLELKNVSAFCTSPFLNFLLRHQQIEHCEKREILSME